MTTEQWAELEKLSGSRRRTKAEELKYRSLLDLTEKEANHPDFFDGACMCRDCRSYG